MPLRAFDLVVALELAVAGPRERKYSELAEPVGLSASEANAPHRAVDAGLLRARGSA